MRFYITLLLLLFSTAARSQEELYLTNYYDFRDGLDHPVVHCMRVDSRGFLWLGTREGLNRFDGFQFKKYFTQKNNPNSISHNKVFDILEYQTGMILFATGSGLSILNTTTGKFENEKIDFPQLKAGSGTIISSMFRDHAGQIYIHHSGEIDILDKDLKYLYRFTDLPWAKPLKGIIIRYEDWKMDRDGRLWLPSDDSGLHIVDVKHQVIYNHENNPDHLPYLKSQSIRSFLLDEERHMLWVAPWGEGLMRHNLVNGSVDQVTFNLSERGESRTINSLIKTRHGTILLAINGTCYEVDTETLSIRHVKEASGKLQYVSSGQSLEVNSSVIVSNGDHQYWIGGTGLHQLDDQINQNVLKVLPQDAAKECVDILLTKSGMVYSLHENASLVAVQHNRKDFRVYPLPIDPQTSMTELCEDSNGLLWIGTTHGIRYFDPSDGLKSTPRLPAELSSAHINVLHRDRKNNIWIGTRYPFRLYRHDAASGQTFQIPQDTLRQFIDAGRNGRISLIEESEDGRLWMVSLLGGGILSYDVMKDYWMSYPLSQRHRSTLVNKGIVSIRPGKEGVLWLSTVFGDGLILYDYHTDSLAQYTREQGLQSDHLQAVTKGKDNDLWLTSEYGVTQFNTISRKAVSHTLFETDRFQFESFKATYDPQRNELLLGMHDKHIYISTQSGIKGLSTLKPLLDRISVNNKDQFIPLDQPELRLDHTQKNVTIDFTTVHFSNADKVRFAYQLMGADEEWQYTMISRSAQYAALSPGNYIFNLRVADETGNWGPVHKMVSFTIVPPFWKSIWFLLSAFVLIFLLATFIVRKRFQAIRKQAYLNQRIVETEMMALRAQMNPHFIFNCINSIDYLIQRNDKYHATVYLNKFAKLIRSILDSSKQNMVTLAKDLETLKLYIELEQFRNENKFTADIQADPVLLRDDFKVPPMIIQPYVENAILHGLRNRPDSNGRLTIAMNKVNGHIQYIIEDNGVGRKKGLPESSRDKISYGMQMSSDRVRLFNKEEHASVEITDLVHEGVPAGTRVEVKLKMT